MEATITLNALSPFVDAAILASPRSKDRAVKGAMLLTQGKVQRISVDGWLVYGSGSEPYQVSIHAGTCDCGDRSAQVSKLGQKLCKHMYAAMFGLKAGMDIPVEVAASADDEADPDADLWAADEDPDAILDAEIAAKLDELVAAGLDADADLLVIGDWIWLVGDVDGDLADSLGCRWHDRRGVHYWRPVWASMDVDGFNEKKDLMGLAEKYGLKRSLTRRSRQAKKSAVELAMLIVPKLNRDEDGELWA
ncbi:MAG: hypothetical protein WBO46_23180 [Caldilineaceae bacterium]